MMEIITLLFALSSSGEDGLPDKPPLLLVRRIYVDRLTGGETAAQMRDMLISSLESAKVFLITENPERADAILRGAAEDLIYTDKFNSSDNLNAHGGIGSGNTRSSTSGRSLPRSASISIGENESTHIEERKHEATAAVRLVDKNGDVIWSTTKESTGGKFRGASADVADRITKQLVADWEKLRRDGASR